VRRAEAMRLFVYWDPTDGIEYVGSLSGQDFSLAGSFNSGSSFSLGCLSGGQVEVILTGRVSGRFSDDGRSISAEEVLSYLVVRTGEQVDVRSRWAATAPADLRIDANPILATRALQYPASEIYYFKPLDERVPVFQTPFRLVQTMAVSTSRDAQAALKGVDTVTISGLT